MIDKVQGEELISTWAEMGRHLRSVSEHMVAGIASQTAVANAAQQSTKAVKIAVCGFLVFLSVAGLTIGLMVQASIENAAAQRAGLRFQLEAIQQTLDKQAMQIAELRRTNPPQPIPASIIIEKR